MSYLTEVRGLKFARCGSVLLYGDVVPHGGTWIEIDDPVLLSYLSESYLTEVRGLKLVPAAKLAGVGVVPHGGTWIEIAAPNASTGTKDKSYLTEVRGLKFRSRGSVASRLSRTSRRYVD